MSSIGSIGVLRTDIRIKRVALHYLPVQPSLSSSPSASSAAGTDGDGRLSCLRVALDAENCRGAVRRGWGEVPLDMQWMWPRCELGGEQQMRCARTLAAEIARRLPETLRPAHPLEISTVFMESELPDLAAETALRTGAEELPLSLCRGVFAAFDLALHDAFAQANGIPVFAAYDEHHLRRDLSFFFGGNRSFSGAYPAHFLRRRPLQRIESWHTVGADDPLEAGERAGGESRNGFPPSLREWIRTEGLRLLKVILSGGDVEADWERLCAVGGIALQEGITALAVGFHGPVGDEEYLRVLLLRLHRDAPELFSLLRFIEQPFSADLQREGCGVDGLTWIKPLLLDESALDWRTVSTGASLGWSGAALSSCKSQTAMLLAYCWLRQHGLKVLVQAPGSPMLAQLSHLQMAANLRTEDGAEASTRQHHPLVSREEASIHPGAYHRREGMVDLSTLGETGFGYRVAEIRRPLPEAEEVVETLGCLG